MIKKPQNSLIRLQKICQYYQKDKERQDVLTNINISINRGETCAFVGPSGSGKSTLLNILGLLDSPTTGIYFLNGVNVANATIVERAFIRNKEIGFIFQSFNLLPRLSIVDNVALPLFYRGYSKTKARLSATAQIERVGLKNHALYRPAELSGGQRQRVAIARALVGEPSLILADEPTGNLDHATGQDILELLASLNNERSVTLVIVTHDNSIAHRMDRKFTVEHRNVVEWTSSMG